jgi:hypothetical protein
MLYAPKWEQQEREGERENILNFFKLSLFHFLEDWALLFMFCGARRNVAGVAAC